MWQGAIKELVDLYKFEHNREAATRIAQLLDATLPQLAADTVVCYIPDIPAHRRARGTDHMKVIAMKFAKARKLSTLPLLQRQTYYSQRGLTKVERLKRQEGAFIAKKSPDTEHCLLLDDVYTTGATIRSGVVALREAGIDHVYVGLVARQPLDEQADL
jgi:predicted amidophosphoribosyltransferase